MITPLEAYTLMAKAVKKWGAHSQILMCVEECNELTLKLLHSERRLKQVSKEEIAKEISDVKLMTEALQIIFKISNPELAALRQANLKRLRKLLE